MGEMMMKLSKTSKKQLLIYVIAAYGVTYLMGLLMGYGYSRGVDVTVFPNAQMLYPAAGVMLAYLLTRKEDSQMPRRFYLTYLAVTVLAILCAVCSVFMPSDSWMLICNSILMVGSVLGWIMLLTEKKEKRIAYGLKGQKGKESVFCVILFVGLYLLRTVISYAVSGDISELGSIAANPLTWIMAGTLVLNFFLVFIAFFGEEYGWRYYLQPLLQSCFGKRWGVILLGVVWGIWHLPVNFFFYSPGTGFISAVGQQISCITLGIFFAYAYMKTENIWVPVMLHFLNNNLIPIITGTYSADVIQGQTVSWIQLVPSLVINGVLFGGFLLAKEFREEK